MVSITIYIEGGLLPHPNIPATTMNNSNRLREGFNKLFRQVFAVDDFDLKVEMGSGEKQAAIFFKEAVAKKEDAILLLDVYKHKDKKAKLEDFKLEHTAQQVFFMVREMEAWILSQLDVIEQFGVKENLIRQRTSTALIEDKLLENKAVTTINKPSETLKIVLGRYFKNRKGKKQKYGKLKHAPSMIELLDLNILRTVFEDVENLILYIESKKEQN